MENGSDEQRAVLRASLKYADVLQGRLYELSQKYAVSIDKLRKFIDGDESALTGFQVYYILNDLRVD